MGYEKQLKPCPFCGGKAYCSSGLSHYADVRYCVTCEDCGIRTHVERTKEEVYEAWNRRVNDGK